MFVANVFPRFAITEDEAQRLADAICNYLRHTKVKVDPKTRDLWALISCIAMVEGTRLVMTLKDLAAIKAAKNANNATGAFAAPLDPAQGNVYAMPASRP